MPLRIRRRRTVSASPALGALLAGLLASGARTVAGAQAAVDAPEVRAEPAGGRVPRLVLGGGVDADGKRRGGYPRQFALHAGYQLRGGESVGGPKLGVRLGLDYTASGGRTSYSEDDSPFERRSRGLGLVLLGTYALARGPVRPYLVGGVGVYRHWSATTYPTVELAGALTTPGYVPPPRVTQRTDERGVGASGGLGLSAAVGRVALFGEARLTVVPMLLLSDRPGVRGSQIPLVLGVRF